MHKCLKFISLNMQKKINKFKSVEDVKFTTFFQVWVCFGEQPNVIHLAGTSVIPDAGHLYLQTGIPAQIEKERNTICTVVQTELLIYLN